MGASEWSYFVPYQDDWQQALDDLRQAVFARDEFHHGAPWWHEMAFEAFLPPEDLDADELAKYRAEFDRRQALPPPTTIEEWLDWNGEDGTHSILDMSRVVATVPPQPAWSTYATDPHAWIAAKMARIGAVFPPTAEELMTIVGTLYPTHDQILQHRAALRALRDRGEGIIVAVYQHDQPHELYFAGVSGD